MTLRDDLLPLFDLPGLLEGEFGVRRATVSVVVETWSGPVGVATSTLVSTVTLPITPAPTVVEGNGQVGYHPGGGYFGGGLSTLSAGRLEVGQFLVGPITKPYTGGGYSAAQLAPGGGATKRVYYLLTGDQFLGGGERFELVHLAAGDPFTTSLVLQRKEQAT
ncbi:MAG: hypothetical protein JWM10_3018 [Myxococcaceae bacterium]|nr:hypothetical protein [Myxococcaceae bacterium]